MIEEVEIATNVKLNQLYVIDLKDEIASLQWVTRIIRWVLDQAIDGRHQFGVTRIQMELEEIEKVENMIHDRIEGLEIELEDSNTDREKEIIVNQTGTLKCVLDHLLNLKYGDKVHAVEIAEPQQEKYLKKRLNKIQDVEPKQDSG